MEDPFESTFRTLNKCMHRYGKDLRANEALRRYALIDPVLVALGWNFSDPDQFMPEYRPCNGKREAIGYRLTRSSFSMIMAQFVNRRYGGRLFPDSLGRSVRWITSVFGTGFRMWTI